MTALIGRLYVITLLTFRFSGTYWANYTTALGTMLHELGHCFDLDHTREGIMRRGGDDLNLLLAFPPVGAKTPQVGV